LVTLSQGESSVGFDANLVDFRVRHGAAELERGIDSMTEQRAAGGETPAPVGSPLKRYRLFTFFDVKEKPSARQLVEGGGLYTLRRRFIGHDLSTTHLAAFGGHPITHPGRNDDAKLWREVGGAEGEQSGKAGFVVADDLHPAVIAALGGGGGTAAGRHLPALELTPAGLNLLNGQYARPPGNPKEWAAADAELFDPKRKGLSLALTPAAQRRLKTAETEILATIVSAVAIFPSHFGLVIVELEVSLPGREPVDALWIEEALHVLSNRGRRSASTLAAFKQPVPGALADVMAVAFPLEHCETDPWNRLYTYTVLVLDQFPKTGADAEVDAIAFRCARHYTADYGLRRDMVAAAVQRPFESVAHVFSLEGAASVVDGSDPFLGDQFASRAGNLYIWLVALAYHEHVYLIDLVQKQVPVEGGDQPESASMAVLIEDFLKFRLRHRMPLVSDVEMHNQVYGGLRRSLRLDALSDKLSGDAAAVERAISQRDAISANRRRELQRERLKRGARRDAWLSAGIIFGLTFLAFSSLIEKIEKLLTPQLADHWKDLSVLIGASSFALLGAIVEFNRRWRDAMSERAEGEGDILEAASEIAADESDGATQLAAAAGSQSGHG
jgi:hypothetical protein